ncbi:hypothetical protein BHE74_00056861 [Ensete ventricosum]|nr:hypothetical protein BHE74_00056861 [Ensete ventricosum]
MASVPSESRKCTAQELDVEGVDVPDIDDALLMEMLESSCCADEDQLYGVIRSLEAEIGHGDVVMIDDGESTTGPSDGGLEDILSDLESHEGLRSGVHRVKEDPFDWVEMDATANSACHDLLPDWYCMEAEDTLCYGEGRDYAGFYCCGESLTEQVDDSGSAAGGRCSRLFLIRLSRPPPGEQPVRSFRWLLVAATVLHLTS